MTELHRVVTRSTPGQVHVYVVPPAGAGAAAVEPTMSHPTRTPGRVHGHSAAPDADGLVYAVGDEVVCVHRSGVEAWRLTLGSSGPHAGVASTSCVHSRDGTVVWVYSPDCMADRADRDRWLAVEAASGAVIAEATLDCVGHGGHQRPHPDGLHMLLDVGEGQDGSRTYLARLDGHAVEVRPFPWNDRCLIDVSPDGTGFMTVHHGQEDVTIHTFPGGNAGLWLPVTAFGHDRADARLDWAGGYLDSTTALVTINGDTDDTAWHEHYTVDVRTGQVLRKLDLRTPVPHELQPLGDGTWLAPGPGTGLTRGTPDDCIA